MAFNSSVVPGIRESPGVFGWLIMRSLDNDDENGRALVGPFAFSKSALTVGVYDDTTKSETQDPGGGFSF